MNAAAIRRCRAEQAAAAAILRRNGGDFQAMLWYQDWLKEETLLLLEHRHESRTSMKISYRAQFRQPVGVLNPLGVTVRAVLTVELLHAAGYWIARLQGTIEERLGRHPGAQAAMQAVQSSFAEQLTPWQMHAVNDGLPISPDEIAAGPDTRGWITLKPLTHITDFAAEAADKTQRRTVHAPCGKAANPKLIVSVKTGVPPTCPICREVYEREYAHTRTA